LEFENGIDAFVYEYVTSNRCNKKGDQ